MARFTRRTALTAAGVGALVGVGYALSRAVDPGPPAIRLTDDGNGGDGGMMGPGMMGGATQADMGIYMEMFRRHNEIRRVVEEIPGGVRTTTESDAPELVAQLQAHLSSMYHHLEQGAEVMCMSASLPTLFRRADGYRRQLTFTANGVIAEETAEDAELVRSIRDHAREVTGFVDKGMPAMMEGMMGGGMMGPR
ncbi:hypothetical protein [Mycolicibacterium wolinskyi]|uniref:hypothetical protein n=1 Tax=Mycolicibacterium wolinskyi TaxID=59750 RepID=UPI000DA236D2|nr:hypothetical protein [Mycolicibacterium wolinskyi]